MSDQIKHECGIVLMRLLKPLDFYLEKYGTPLYGLHKLQLLMQKMRNRGQDGAGVATIKLDLPAGSRYISRKRSNATNSLQDVFDGIYQHFEGIEGDKMDDMSWLKENIPYVAEVMLGHLRYGTHGTHNIENVHPFLRQSNWMTRNLVLAGNFNLTNTDELFDLLVELGQSPKEKSDTVTMLEKIGHFLDDEVLRLTNWYIPEGYSKVEINELVIKNLNIHNVLRRAAKEFDGGYVMGGMTGHGDAFLMRDPNGIRPAFWYADDEIFVGASERPAIQTAFNIHISKIKELDAGHALVIKKDGKIIDDIFTEPKEKTSCSFERIYFSRGNDKDIYLERKYLGELLSQPVLEAVNYDFKSTVFTFIPNTAETAFIGFVEGITRALGHINIEKIKDLKEDITPEKLEEIILMRPRVEKICVKDEKLRTFITGDDARSELVSHVYDVTYGIVENEVDTLVVLDDSIVRGTTLKNSIIRILARLRPKKIILVSSAPQIRYPDCYGIDMSKLGDFVAFKAMVALLKETGRGHLLDECYDKCKAMEEVAKEETPNLLMDLYALFSYEEITKKIAEIVTPEGIRPEVQVIFQTLDGLHQACPNHKGDWYFSGRYPTPGGNRVVNRSFINFMENKNIRAY